MKRNSNKNSAVGFHVTAVWETVAKADKKNCNGKKMWPDAYRKRLLCLEIKKAALGRTAFFIYTENN
jgi:hypothetical protein